MIMQLLKWSTRTFTLSAPFLAVPRVFLLFTYTCIGVSVAPGGTWRPGWAGGPGGGGLYDVIIWYTTTTRNSLRSEKDLKISILIGYVDLRIYFIEDLSRIYRGFIEDLSRIETISKHCQWNIDFIEDLSRINWGFIFCSIPCVN
mgnify:CR=1 FL=1